MVMFDNEFETLENKNLKLKPWIYTLSDSNSIDTHCLWERVSMAVVHVQYYKCMRVPLLVRSLVF